MTKTSLRNRHNSSVRWCIGAVLGAAAVLFGSISTLTAESGDIAETRASIERWVEAKKLISKERNDWELGREILQDRIALVQREIETARKQIAESHENITTADQQRQELVARNQTLESGSNDMLAAVTAMEARIHRLISRLPDPALERIEQLTGRLPDGAADTDLTVSERYLTVVGIVNEINKFAREVTMTSEVRQLADGSSAEVTAIYIGLGQGYYVGGNGTIAGIGTATDAGWQWTENNSAAERISQAIAILKNESVASFVKLPVDIQ